MTQLTDSVPSELECCRRRYAANLAALYLRDPRLAAAIDGVPFERCPELEPARDGGLTAQVVADDGRPVYLHSRYRPGQEAAALIESLGEVENPAFHVSGVGLGHHLAALERRFDRPLIIAAEDELPLIKAAMCCVDLSAPIAAGRLLFITRAEKGELHGRLSVCNADLMLGLKMFSLPHVQRFHSAFHAAVRELTADFVAYCKMQMVTTLTNGRITCRNIAHNLPAYVDHPGVESLAGRAAGYPAVVVAAGPSLARNVEQLAELRSRAVLVAVQTVFKPLLARGCPPHFVVSLDFHEISAQFFQGVGACDTVLVAEPKAHWHVLDAYRGRTLVLQNRFADELLREAAPKRGALKAGTTVAHLAFYLAQHLGCDPIILVGQDLAYCEGLYYPPGMPIEDIWRPELGRFCTLEMKQLERIARGRPILRKVTDVHGREAYSDEQMLTYAEQFQTDFAASRARVIHACEGGMRLAGTEAMTLREAAQRFCVRALPPGAWVAHAPPAEGGRALAIASLEARIAELKELRRICAEMSPLLDQLSELVERPAEFNRLVVRVDRLRAAMHALDRTYRLVLDVSQTAELRRYARDRRAGDDSRDSPAVARRRLARDREFVAALTEGADFLLETLPESIRRLRERPP